MFFLRQFIVCAVLVLTSLSSHAGKLNLISVSRDFLYNPDNGELFVIENKNGQPVKIESSTDGALLNFKLDKDIPRASFKEIDIYTDAKQRRYLGLRAQNKEVLISKAGDGSWRTRLIFEDADALEKDPLPRKLTMLISDKLGTAISIRSMTYDQRPHWFVNTTYLGQELSPYVVDLVKTFVREIPRVGVPTLEQLDDYVQKYQPNIHRILTKRFQLQNGGPQALAELAADPSKFQSEEATKKGSDTSSKTDYNLNPNKSLSGEIPPELSIRDSSFTGKGRRPGPNYPLSLPGKKEDAIENEKPNPSDNSSSEPLVRKQIFVKGQDGKPTDAWAIIDTVADDLRKLSADKPYLDDPELRQIEDRILRNLLKPQGGGMKLLGPAGSGKSFLLERLAIRFAKGDVPAELRGYQILQTSAIQLQAGTMYVGTIDATINAMIELSKEHKILWIVDEAHALKDTGTHKNKSTNVLQGLLPGMAQGFLKFLLASTPDNWSAAFESDTAFDRRLDRVDIVEANQEQLQLRLKNWMSRYQLPAISDSLLERIIFYSGEFAIEGSQLSKATSLLNEIASFKSMKADRAEITLEDVKLAVKELYNVDAAELEADRKIERYQKLVASFENLIGQNEAKDAILRNTRQVFAGVVDRNKPRQRVLLAGLKGQGKTEMVKLFAEAMGLPADNRLVMSEYSTPLDVNKMKERIAQLVRRSPFTVLFFDEIEKAHPDVQKSLLGILDSATMSYSVNDSAPIKISLKNTSIFMATNAGSEFIMRNSEKVSKVKLGFINSDSSTEQNRDISQNQFRQALIADGLNEYLLDRMNIVTPFKILTKDEFKQVLELHFKKGIKEIQRNSQAQVEIGNLAALVDDLGNKLYFPGISNREVERIVNDELRQKAADVLFETGSKKIVLTWKDGQLQPLLPNQQQQSMISCDGVFLK